MAVIPLRPAKGQGTDPSAACRKGQASPGLRLTDAEAMRLRAALRNLRALYGTWACLAHAMGVKPGTLEHAVSGRNGMSPAMALAAARAAGTTVARLIFDKPTDASVCPHCGAKRGAS